MAESEQVVKVFSTLREEEMLVIKSLLDDAGIQCFVKGDDGSVIYGVKQGMFNEMHIYVNSNDAEDVKKIIELMSQEPPKEKVEPLEEGDEGWEEDCGCQPLEE